MFLSLMVLFLNAVTLELQRQVHTIAIQKRALCAETLQGERFINSG